MAGRPKRRARLATGAPALPVHTPASGIPASGIPAGGPGRGPASGIPSGGPASGIPASGLPASGIPASLAPVRRSPAVPPPSHGARTPRVYGELARDLAAGLLADRPDLERYPEAVAAWATAEAQAALLRSYLDTSGPIDPGTTEPRTGVLDLLSRTERAAARHRSSLGLDPRSEASLARERAEAATLTVDLGALAARGRAVLGSRPDLPGLLPAGDAPADDDGASR